MQKEFGGDAAGRRGPSPGPELRPRAGLAPYPNAIVKPYLSEQNRL